jgi:Ribosomal protein L10
MSCLAAAGVHRTVLGVSGVRSSFYWKDALRGNTAEHWRCDTRFCMGSTKVLQVALGKTEADEYLEGLHLVSERVRGSTGLFLTKLPHDEVVKVFEEY